jgi:PAS domain S-box-containing protein
LKNPDEFKNTVYNGFRELSLQNRSIVELKDGRVFDYVSNPMHVDDEAVGRIANFRDITNQARAEGTLRREKDKAQQYLSLAGVMLLALDEHGKVTLVNKRGCEILGYEEGQILGKSWFENFLPESLRDKVRAVFDGLMRGNLGPLEHQPPSPVICGGGVERYIAFTNALLKNERGEIIGTLSSGEDVTERKQTAAALQESEGRYHNLVEGMLEGVAYCRMLYDERGLPVDWIYLTVNSNFEKLTGLRNITGKRVTEAIPGIEKSDPALFEIYGRVASNGKPERFEMDVKSLGQWLRVSAFCPEKDHFVAVFEDITERKKSEVFIAESMEKRRELESIIDRSPAIAFIWKHVPDWSVAFVSSNIRQFGYMPEDFTSRRMTYADLVHPDDLKRVFGESEAYAKEGVSEFTQEYRILTKSGDVRWVDDRTVILRNTAGESVFHQGIIFDVTEHRRVERALRQANKKLALLGSVTRHDAINQLSVLMAWLDIAMEVGKDLPTMEQLTRAQESARMLQGQLEFAAEYQEIGLKQPEWIDLKAAAYAGVEGIDVGAVSLKFDLKGAEIYADPMLEKVFHNLVDNSLRHGKKATQIHLYLEESSESLAIVCEDDGVGIPVDEKEKIFVRGYGKHTGLGLYLVREILELTGIAVKEAGVPGKGARFELLVPFGNYKFGRGG